MKAASLLLEAGEIDRSLGPTLFIEPSREHSAMSAIGGVVAAAARDAAYRSFSGYVVVDGARRPVAVGEMALVFDAVAIAEKTFSGVANAAHLRTQVDGCSVAVETVTAPSGLVSYWGYLQHAEGLIVLTLDTLDPNVISMSTFRALTSLGARRLAGD